MVPIRARKGQVSQFTHMIGAKSQSESEKRMSASDRRIGAESSVNLLILDTPAFANGIKEVGPDHQLAEAIAAKPRLSRPADTLAWQG